MDLKSYLTFRYQEAYDESPWYGTAVRQIIAQLTPPILTVPLPGSKKQLGQIVLHMLAWRQYALAHLRGENDYRLEVNSPEDWPEATIWNNESVLALRDRLDQNQKDLLQAIHEFPLVKMGTTVPGKSYTYAQLMEGVYTHDIYHAGQLQLGWRLLKENGLA